jgi:hypothetical protein
LNDCQKDFYDIVNKLYYNIFPLNFYDIVKKLLKYFPSESFNDGGGGFLRCILLQGQGGTGKSNMINSIILQLQPCEQCTFAPQLRKQQPSLADQ